ncbi:unnamed protein product [Rangifer tarandus platyrhynchus]|uniref:Uncharacterized protein n=1 Tax=Rangifer tarandus platyrhynchus TaxID=3082113 RepID=A0AC59Z6V7_RANTA
MSRRSEMSLLIREPCKTFLMSLDDGAHFSRVPGLGRQWIESPPRTETPAEAFPAPVLFLHTGHTLVILPGHSESWVDAKAVLWTPTTQSIHSGQPQRWSSYTGLCLAGNRETVLMTKAAEFTGYSEGMPSPPWGPGGLPGGDAIVTRI